MDDKGVQAFGAFDLHALRRNALFVDVVLRAALGTGDAHQGLIWPRGPSGGQRSAGLQHDGTGAAPQDKRTDGVTSAPTPAMFLDSLRKGRVDARMSALLVALVIALAPPQ